MWLSLPACTSCCRMAGMAAWTQLCGRRCTASGLVRGVTLLRRLKEQMAKCANAAVEKAGQEVEAEEA